VRVTSDYQQQRLSTMVSFIPGDVAQLPPIGLARRPAGEWMKVNTRHFESERSRFAVEL